MAIGRALDTSHGQRLEEPATAPTPEDRVSINKINPESRDKWPNGQGE